MIPGDESGGGEKVGAKKDKQPLSVIKKCIQYIVLHPCNGFYGGRGSMLI